jgi:hypothetical protein
MNIKYEDKQRRIMLCQSTYINALVNKYHEYVPGTRRLPIAHGIQLNKEQEDLEHSQKPYLSLVGALLFLSVCTRPDISFVVGVLTKFMLNPGEAHWRVAVEVLAYLRGTLYKGICLGYHRYQEVFCFVEGVL